jgi:hypothetical protein
MPPLARSRRRAVLDREMAAEYNLTNWLKEENTMIGSFHDVTLPRPRSLDVMADPLFVDLQSAATSTTRRLIDPP